MDDFRTELGETYLHSLDIDNGKPGKQYAEKIITNQPLYSQAGLAYSALEKTEVFAATMEGQFQVHRDIHNDEQEESGEHYMEEIFHEKPEDVIQPSTLYEVWEVICRENPGGPQGWTGLV